MTDANKIPDAPVYNASMEEMGDLSNLISNASHLALQYGAVRIDPPSNWKRPNLRMRTNSRFFVRHQTLPEAPFVNRAALRPTRPTPEATAPLKRRRRPKRTIRDDDDDDDDDDCVIILNQIAKKSRNDSNPATTSSPIRKTPDNTSPPPRPADNCSADKPPQQTPSDRQPLAVVLVPTTSAPPRPNQNAETAQPPPKNQPPEAGPSSTPTPTQLLVEEVPKPMLKPRLNIRPVNVQTAKSPAVKSPRESKGPNDGRQHAQDKAVSSPGGNPTEWSVMKPSKKLSTPRHGHAPAEGNPSDNRRPTAHATAKQTPPAGREQLASFPKILRKGELRQPVPRPTNTIPRPTTAPTSQGLPRRHAGSLHCVFGSPSSTDSSALPHIPIPRVSGTSNSSLMGSRAYREGMASRQKNPSHNALLPPPLASAQEGKACFVASPRSRVVVNARPAYRSPPANSTLPPCATLPSVPGTASHLANAPAAQAREASHNPQSTQRPGHNSDMAGQSSRGAAPQQQSLAGSAGLIPTPPYAMRAGFREDGRVEPTNARSNLPPARNVPDCYAEHSRSVTVGGSLSLRTARADRKPLPKVHAACTDSQIVDALVLKADATGSQKASSSCTMMDLANVCEKMPAGQAVETPSTPRAAHCNPPPMGPSRVLEVAGTSANAQLIPPVQIGGSSLCQRSGQFLAVPASLPPTSAARELKAGLAHPRDRLPTGGTRDGEITPRNSAQSAHPAVRQTAAVFGPSQASLAEGSTRVAPAIEMPSRSHATGGRSPVKAEGMYGSKQPFSTGDVVPERVELVLESRSATPRTPLAQRAPHRAGLSGLGTPAATISGAEASPRNANSTGVGGGKSGKVSSGSLPLPKRKLNLRSKRPDDPSLFRLVNVQSPGVSTTPNATRTIPVAGDAGDTIEKQKGFDRSMLPHRSSQNIEAGSTQACQRPAPSMLEEKVRSAPQSSDIRNAREFVAGQTAGVAMNTVHRAPGDLGGEPKAPVSRSSEEMCDRRKSGEETLQQRRAPMSVAAGEDGVPKQRQVFEGCYAVSACLSAFEPPGMVEVKVKGKSTASRGETIISVASKADRKSEAGVPTQTVPTEDETVRPHTPEQGQAAACVPASGSISGLRMKLVSKTNGGPLAPASKQDDRNTAAYEVPTASGNDDRMIVDQLCKGDAQQKDPASMIIEPAQNSSKSGPSEVVCCDPPAMEGPSKPKADAAMAGTTGGVDNDNDVVISEGRESDLEEVSVKRANVRTTRSRAGVVKPIRNDTKRPTLKRPVTVDRPAPHYNQDGRGRLTKSIMFPDSEAPLTLENYKKDAASLKTRISREIPNIVKDDEGEATVPTESDEELIKRVDLLEGQFWRAMTDGINGKPVTVAYGVDVEAEGAFHTEGNSYVEWYGTGADGRIVKSNQFEKPKPESGGRKRKYKEEVKLEGEEIKVESSEVKAEPTVLEQNDMTMGCEGDSEDDEILDGDDETFGADDRPIKRAKMESVPKARRGPESHVGNLNQSGVLRHLPLMPGINHTMFYIGQLFTRFCWHVEDAYLNSVSYLHDGSSEKIWYAVPPSFASKFDHYASERVFSPEMLENDQGQVLLMNKTTIFDPRGLRKNGIDVYRVIHRPGSFVLTAARAYHAGFNCGFNVAEAVNFANCTWFPVGRVAAVFARAVERPLCVPWEYLLFHEAKALRDDRSKMGSLSEQRREGMRKNAKIMAEELRRVLFHGEAAIAKYVKAKNCRISMLKEVDMLVKDSQLGPEFGPGAGIICTSCGHACHFYAEICGSCKSNQEARCVYHFGKAPKLCKIAGHRGVIVRRHEPVMLLDLLEALEKLAGIEVSYEEKYRRTRHYVRTWDTPMQKTSGLRLKLNLVQAASRLPPKLAEGKSAKGKYGTAEAGNKKRARSERGDGKRKRNGGDNAKRKAVDSEVELVSTKKARKNGNSSKAARSRKPTTQQRAASPNASAPPKEENAIADDGNQSDILFIKKVA